MKLFAIAALAAVALAADKKKDVTGKGTSKTDIVTEKANKMACHLAWAASIRIRTQTPKTGEQTWNTTTTTTAKCTMTKAIGDTDKAVFIACVNGGKASKECHAFRWKKDSFKHNVGKLTATGFPKATDEDEYTTYINVNSSNAAEYELKSGKWDKDKDSTSLLTWDTKTMSATKTASATFSSTGQVVAKDKDVKTYKATAGAKNKFMLGAQFRAKDANSDWAVTANKDMDNDVAAQNKAKKDAMSKRDKSGAAGLMTALGATAAAVAALAF
jgi:hypothetical protein